MRCESKFEAAFFLQRCQELIALGLPTLLVILAMTASICCRCRMLCGSSALVVSRRLYVWFAGRKRQRERLGFTPRTFLGSGDPALPVRVLARSLGGGVE